MDIQKLISIANVVDAKGLHSLATEIEGVAQRFGSEKDQKVKALENSIHYFSEPIDDLIKIADVLDSRGFAALANKLDKIIEIEALEQQSAIDAILTIYKKKHKIAGTKEKGIVGIVGMVGTCGLCKEAGIRKDNLPAEQRCPFGLPIPQGCSQVGAAIQDMVARKPEFAQNKRLFDKYKTGKKCPYAEQILEGKNAVNCSFGTEVEGREVPKMYRGSPIYPRLFEGFSTINLDRSYYQYHDFSFYSLYG